MTNTHIITTGPLIGVKSHYSQVATGQDCITIRFVVGNPPSHKLVDTYTLIHTYLYVYTHLNTHTHMHREHSRQETGILKAVKGRES